MTKEVYSTQKDMHEVKYALVEARENGAETVTISVESATALLIDVQELAKVCSEEKALRDE